jgi:hypothetical protein
MKKAHLEEQRNLLLERREKQIGQFSDATRKRKNTARVCAQLRRTNEFLASLERVRAPAEVSARCGGGYAVYAQSADPA